MNATNMTFFSLCLQILAPRVAFTAEPPHDPENPNPLFWDKFLVVTIWAQLYSLEFGPHGFLQLAWAFVICNHKKREIQEEYTPATAQKVLLKGSFHVLPSWRMKLRASLPSWMPVWKKNCTQGSLPLLKLLAIFVEISIAQFQWTFLLLLHASFLFCSGVIHIYVWLLWDNSKEMCMHYCDTFSLYWWNRSRKLTSNGTCTAVNKPTIKVTGHFVLPLPGTS